MKLEIREPIKRIFFGIGIFLMVIGGFYMFYSGLSLSAATDSYY